MTPWQKVYERFGLTGRQLAIAIGRDRSKITRALKSEAGLISGKDQVLLLEAAKRLNVALTSADLLPDND
jgi:hypothetical protein